MDGNFYRITDADCAELVESYDPNLYAAAMVKGHPKQEDPRFGSINELSLSPQKVVLAAPAKVDPAFADEVNSGKYPYISAKLYAPKSKGNPKPGKLYLRHVGFLGAVPPAVKGMKKAQIDQAAVSFSECQADEVSFACAEVKAVKTDSGEFILEFSEINFEQEERMDATQLAKAEADLNGRIKLVSEKEVSFSEREKGLGERETRIAAKELAIKRQGITDFVEAQVKAARIPSGMKNGLIEFMSSLDEEDVLEFSEGEKAVKKPAVDFIKDLLSSLTPMVSFGETAGGEQVNTEDPAVLARKATEYRNACLKNGQEISFSEAVDHIAKGGK